VENAETNLKQFARVLDDHLADRRYVVAQSVSVADFALAAALPYTTTSRLPLDEFTHIRRWHDRLNEIEAWRDPFPRPNS
jgi:glutathione S-transferase